MTSIGETLRSERLQQGLDLQQLSQTTKIGTRMLQAMEQNDFSKLPGGVFTRSFIRQYAAALGMEPNALDEQVSNLQIASDEPPKNEPRKEVITEGSHYSLSDYNSSRNPSSFLMSLVWVALAVAVGGAVYFLMNRTPVSVTPQRSSTVTSEPAPVAVVEPVPALASTPSSPVEVVLTAKEKTWVSITADGKSQFVGDMQLNEKRTVQAQERVKLIAGNAGGLDVQLNGKPVDAIGPKGQVRVVEFTSAGTHVVPRTPKPVPLP